MEQRRQALAKAVLSEALKVPSADRIRLIQEAFPDDPRAWDELLEILDGYSKASEINSGWTGGTTFGHLIPELATPAPPPATVLLAAGAAFGPYRVVRSLRPGGMGEVAVAEDIRLPRQVVLKCLAGRWLESPLARQRLLREARTAAALNHRNIAMVYDVLEERDPPVLVLEYVEGRSLHDILAEGPVPLGLALRYAIQITHAVGYAHDRGIIHCDIKPANIQVTPEGIAKVLDFGLARAQFDQGDELSLSERGKVLGTPGYMPPERLTRGILNASGDIYAIGVVLFELLTGGDPYTERGHALMLAVLASDAPAPSSLVPGLPRALDAIVARALARDPMLRYRSARELCRDLEDALASIEGRAWSGQFPIGAVPAPEAGLRPWRQTAALSVVALLFLLTFAGFSTSTLYNSPIGRIESFGESPLSWPRWGASSLVAPTVYITVLLLELVLAVVLLRLIVAAVPPLRRLVRRVVPRARGLAEGLRSAPPATLAAGFLLLQVTVVGALFWRFRPLVDALYGFVIQIPSTNLDLLGPAHRFEHSLFGRAVAVQLLIFGVGWFWILSRAAARADRDAKALAAGGIAITILTLLFGQVIPFRILYHSEAERVRYQTQVCHMVGQSASEALLFCPQQAPAWTRVVRLDDPQLAREGIFESIFTGLSRD